MKAVSRIAAAVLVLTACVSTRATAQTSSPQGPSQSAPAEPRWLFGPVGVTPAISISEIGVDSNVFNEPTNPQSDFTATINPSVTAVMRAGNARLTGNAALGLVYFNRFKDQQSVNGTYEGRVELLLNRVRPWASAGFARTRERSGFEIDLRATRVEPTIRAGTEIRISGRTLFDASYRHSSLDYEQGASFLGADLRTTLNRRADAWTAAIRFLATPLTTVVLLSEFEQTRFDFSTLRDADSLRVTPGVEFNPDALFRGRAYAGYRRFEALGVGVPNYAGPVALVEVSTTVLGATKLDVRAERDVSYSFEPLTPYYVSTGGGLTITQRLAGPFDVRAMGSRARLAYRAVAGTDPVLIGLSPGANAVRLDSIYSAGGGIGYHLGETGRIGINVEYTDRSSNSIVARPFDRLRVYGSFDYGFR